MKSVAQDNGCKENPLPSKCMDTFAVENSSKRSLCTDTTWSNSDHSSIASEKYERKFGDTDSPKPLAASFRTHFDIDSSLKNQTSMSRSMDDSFLLFDSVVWWEQSMSKKEMKQHNAVECFHGIRKQNSWNKLGTKPSSKIAEMNKGIRRVASNLSIESVLSNHSLSNEKQRPALQRALSCDSLVVVAPSETKSSCHMQASKCASESHRFANTAIRKQQERVSFSERRAARSRDKKTNEGKTRSLVEGKARSCARGKDAPCRETSRVERNIGLEPEGRCPIRLDDTLRQSLKSTDKKVSPEDTKEMLKVDERRRSATGRLEKCANRHPLTARISSGRAAPPSALRFSGDAHSRLKTQLERKVADNQKLPIPMGEKFNRKEKSSEAKAA